ncbi:MAG: PTS sugar transporter subunit IIA [Rectinema subterraneum]|uniref:PTS sugar transporter subunit IIA n=1 Tax=Rectinema subterraneum TaxID=2653714 RepID=UPI003C7D32CD
MTQFEVPSPLYLVDPIDVAHTIGQLVSAVELPEGLDREALIDALLAREEVMSTAIGNGIAIPHVRKFGSESLKSNLVYVAYLFEPIDWKAPDGLPVHTLFLVLAADENSHLQILAQIASLASDDSFVEFLKTMPERDALLERMGEISRAQGSQ